MKASNLKRRIKLKALQLKANLANAIAKPLPFTKEQFLGDCAEYSLIVDGVKRLIKPARFTISMVDESELLAEVKKVPGDDYYFVKVSKPALLAPCFDFLEPGIETYFKRHAPALDVNRDLFHRMCMSCATIMAYWHEAAHVVCGHLDYQEKNGKLPAPDWTGDPVSFEPWFDCKVHPLLPTRTMELDADIHGAQFALGHAMHTSEVFRKVSQETYLRAFAVGVRGLFEYLTWGEPHETPAATTPHPAPITRAYVAITHAVARLDKMGVRPNDIERLQQFAQAVLLDFEIQDLGMTVNPEALKVAQETELKLWSRRYKEFVPFQPISANRKAA
ncbi:hypothetical protein AB3X91_37780 [Paraburkholderia sp. BR14263]|uniref:hypothetical protein n=1 Tax=unclassified Paraburkholderia TaxID=2615204 RepID=UPI0034CF020B